MYSYKTSGTCSQQINYDIVDGKVHNVTFVNGCPGNLKAIGILVEGLPVEEVAAKLRGIHCGNRSTSCGDQLAQALEQHLNANPKERGHLQCIRSSKVHQTASMSLSLNN